MIPENRVLVRKYESKSLKLIKTKCKHDFNKICINNGLFPKYTNIKLLDTTANEEDFAVNFRRNLVIREIQNCLSLFPVLSNEIQDIYTQMENNIEPDLLTEIIEVVRDNVNKQDIKIRNKMRKKLSNLYGSRIFQPEQTDCYINLSKYKLTTEEKDFLNLGLNCHIKSKVDKQRKKLELELLYQDLLKLKDDKIVEVNPNINDQLKAEGGKQRGSGKSTLLTSKMRETAKSLRTNNDIIIRRADKSNIFVILDTDTYKDRLDRIINDKTKFKIVSSNPTGELKKEANALIERSNGLFKEIIGDYYPGYLYGTVKTHKEDASSLRPVISQVTTPIYNLSKDLDKLIKSYIPSKYIMKSRDEFLYLLRSNDYDGSPYSLDVESLFTNVPVKDTIDIILNNVYNNKEKNPPKIEKEVLKELLILCTTKVPFRHINGKIYIQVDGVSMGSPLGPTFADFYMAEVENKVLESISSKPPLYTRYVDDIFVITTKTNLLKLKDLMESNSKLRFTYEEPIGATLPFLDILISKRDTEFETKVYKKKTDAGKCLNYESECPDRYKKAVITAYINRAIHVCSSREVLDEELNRVTQLLVNNNFPQYLVQREIKKMLVKYNENKENVETKMGSIKLFYQNQMNDGYKMDEKVLNKIIKDNVKSTDPEKKVSLNVYYRSLKTKNLIMKNNMNPPKREIDKTNVIYEYRCPFEDCNLYNKNNSYIGFTKCTLTRRIAYHIQNGAIKAHNLLCKNQRIKRPQIVNNIKILYQINDVRRLENMEALLINTLNPELNKQDTGKVRKLKLW